MKIQKKRSISLVLLLGASVALADDAGVCRRAKDKAAGVKTAVFTSHASIDTSAGYVKGLNRRLCIFNNGTNEGAVDLQTLGSKRQSIAATYMLKGLDLDALGLPPPGVTPEPWYCGKLSGSSISQVANGGFVDKSGGALGMCAFGDGSMVGTWELIYISLDPAYLSMRKAVKSEPLSLSLPYLGSGR